MAVACKLLRTSGSCPSLAAAKMILELPNKDPFDAPNVDTATRRGTITRPAVPIVCPAKVYN